MKSKAYLIPKRKIYLPILSCVNIFVLLFSSMHILFQLNSLEIFPLYIGKVLSVVLLYLPVCDIFFLIPSFLILLAVIVSEVIGIHKGILGKKEIIIFTSLNFATIALLISRCIWWMEMFKGGLFK